MEKVEQHIMRLREFYDVYYYKGAFNFGTRKFEGKKYDDAEVVRIFPLEEITKDKTIIDMGMISVKNDDVVRTETYEELFEAIPNEVTENEYINYDKLEILEKIAKENNMSDEEIIKTFLPEYEKQLLNYNEQNS